MIDVGRRINWQFYFDSTAAARATLKHAHRDYRITMSDENERKVTAAENVLRDVEKAAWANYIITHRGCDLVAFLHRFYAAPVSE